MLTSSKVILYPKANKIELSALTLLPIGADDVLLRTVATSITPGVERLILTGKSITRRELKFPVVSGSELIGEVIALGNAVHDLQIGEYVFAWRALPFLETQSVFGCQAERVVVNREHLVPLGKLPDEPDTLLGLVGYAISVVKKISLPHTERILILGLGSVGLMIAEYLKHLDFTSVDACETFLIRAKLAAARDIAFDIKDFTPEFSDRYDVIIETTGRLLLLEESLRLLKPQGIFLLAGSYDVMQLDYRLIQDKEPTLMLSSQLTLEDMEEAKRVLASPTFNASKFITHRFSALTDFERAFDVALSRSEAIKTILTW
jgi:bacteriochlorophyllide a dehydrogenase